MVEGAVAVETVIDDHMEVVAHSRVLGIQENPIGSCYIVNLDSVGMMRRGKVVRSWRIDGLDLGCNDYPDKPSVLLDIVAEGRLVAFALVDGHIDFENFDNIAVQLEDDSYFADTVVNNCALVYGLYQLV